MCMYVTLIGMFTYCKNNVRPKPSHIQWLLQILISSLMLCLSFIWIVNILQTKKFKKKRYLYYAILMLSYNVKVPIIIYF